MLRYRRFVFVLAFTMFASIFVAVGIVVARGIGDERALTFHVDQEQIAAGLIDAEKRLNSVQDIGFVYLNEKDVARHELVQRIITEYEK